MGPGRLTFPEEGGPFGREKDLWSPFVSMVIPPICPKMNLNSRFETLLPLPPPHTPPQLLQVPSKKAPFPFKVCLMIFCHPSP